MFMIVMTGISGCSSYEEALEETDDRYPPMIYVCDAYYIARGETTQTLTDEWEYIGSIEEKISVREKMEKINFTANELDVGTEIYYNEDESEKVYAKFSEEKYIAYEKVEE